MSFSRTFLIVLPILIATSADVLTADMVTVKQLNTKAEGADTLVGVSVTSAAEAPLKQVFVRCAVLDGTGNLVATGLAQFQNLQPGETAYDFAPIRKLGSGNFEFRCRADSIQR
ncbi:FxLYD domain-containing protein [Mesorhizobium amorphae]|uniref:FxLYD domain-containing protein n=1 Tax=Mesorhizobium amorphae TaxID=71433 RepID=UPI0011865354|nr:FxLYD domain-containing protein [Mesorhizobium amorphae]